MPYIPWHQSLGQREIAKLDTPSLIRLESIMLSIIIMGIIASQKHLSIMLE